MAIIPDTKDWTFVLERTCAECGFDVRTFPRERVGQMIRDNAQEWKQLLSRSNMVKKRPAPNVWSALEYACHVRDVFRLYDYRLQLMLEREDPAYPNWDQDAAAVADGYDGQDPERVVEEIQSAAAALADRFDDVPDDAWERTGRRSDGASFTIESFARYLIHDPIHHVADVRRGFDQLQDS